MPLKTENNKRLIFQKFKILKFINKMTSLHEEDVVHFIHSIQKKTGISAEKAAELYLKQTKQGSN